MFFYRKPPSHYLDYVIEDKNPVILIPGVSDKWAFLKKLGDSISLTGHPVYVSHELGSNLLNIPDSSKIIREIIDKNNLKNVVIVGHSKGGLIGKYLLMHTNSNDKIIRLIAIATPFSGSKIVKYLPWKRYKELMPTSKIIREVDSNKKVNSKIISIMPELDTRIWSDKGSFLEGALNIKVPIKGHHKIVFDKNVIKKIIDLIDEKQ